MGTGRARRLGAQSAEAAEARGVQSSVALSWCAVVSIRVVNWRCGVGSDFEVEASALTATFLAAAMAKAQARRIPQRRRAVSIGAA